MTTVWVLERKEEKKGARWQPFAVDKSARALESRALGMPVWWVWRMRKFHYAGDKT